ncbi:MP-1 [Clematis chlorotic mottle virus]|uniref:MP-1 n=1 Tax=Clematis chlorotic mottle virus TaxID=1950126 RepID=A0A1Q1MKB5_9TOMB|nr:MP-1 [Clematis chlorotic mottle virus]AQM36682.1 MP-1 [Clematis chlorotic mottle virus]AYI50029.1 movement protein 1 [Clematis chlorotic mottle virus]
MDFGESNTTELDKTKTNVGVEKKRKRGSAKNKLDVAHNSVGKSQSHDLVGANFITIADKVKFTVHLHF